MIPNHISIEDRPPIVGKRKRCGYCESDLVVSNKRGHGAIAIFAERKTKYLMAELVSEQSADEMVRATTVVFQSVLVVLRQTITHDNEKGTDFSTVTAKELGVEVKKINTMPRQSFRFCTAQEVFSAYVNGYAFES